jgi:hypothetical protein
MVLSSCLGRSVLIVGRTPPKDSILLGRDPPICRCNPLIGWDPPCYRHQFCPYYYSFSKPNTCKWHISCCYYLDVQSLAKSLATLLTRERYLRYICERYGLATAPVILSHSQQFAFCCNLIDIMSTNFRVDPPLAVTGFQLQPLYYIHQKKSGVEGNRDAIHDVSAKSEWIVKPITWWLYVSDKNIQEPGSITSSASQCWPQGWQYSTKFIAPEDIKCHQGIVTWAFDSLSEAYAVLKRIPSTKERDRIWWSALEELNQKNNQKLQTSTNKLRGLQISASIVLSIVSGEKFGQDRSQHR